MRAATGGAVMAVVLCGLGAAAGRASVEGGSGLALEVRARELRPGEPLRISVESSSGLRDLAGTFLDAPFVLTRAGETRGGPERWIGWSMIPLDAPPGSAALQVRGSTLDGRAVEAERGLVVLAASFPVETLDVEPRYVEPPPEVRARIARERDKVAAIYRSATPLAPVTGPFRRPVPGVPTSIFGTRRVYNGRPRDPHPGLDLRAAAGTPVACAGAGRVVLAEDLYFSGHTVIVDHGGGLFTLYAHLSRIQVAEGDSIESGRIIGLSGATGRVTGPHLHWGAKIRDRPFDPTALLDPVLFD